MIKEINEKNLLVGERQTKEQWPLRVKYKVWVIRFPIHWNNIQDIIKRYFKSEKEKKLLSGGFD